MTDNLLIFLRPLNMGTLKRMPKAILHCNILTLAWDIGRGENGYLNDELKTRIVLSS